MLAHMPRAHHRQLVSSASSARINDHRASNTKKVRRASGIRKRVKRNSPMQVPRVTPSVETCKSTDSPSCESSRQPHCSDSSEGNHQPGCPIVHTEQAKEQCDEPVFERGLFHVGDAIEAGGDEIAALQHVTRDLGLNGIDVVHQEGRADATCQENNCRKRQDNPLIVADEKGGFGLIRHSDQDFKQNAEGTDPPQHGTALTLVRRNGSRRSRQRHWQSESRRGATSIRPGRWRCRR